jgi:hypothetical protein
MVSDLFFYQLMLVALVGTRPVGQFLWYIENGSDP